MPSQPDFEAAHRLNPDKNPANPVQLLNQTRAMLSFVADELAAKTGSTRAEVLERARKAAGADASTLPQREEVKVTEKSAAVKVEKDRAAFFASRERGVYFPIEMLDGQEGSDIVFFENEEEAKANGFEDAPETDGGEKEEAKTEKPKTKKKGK